MEGTNGEKGTHALSPVIESAIRGVREFIELFNHELDLKISMGFDRPQRIQVALHKKGIAGAHRAPLQSRTPSCRGGL